MTPRRIRRELIRRATSAWRGAMTPEQRMQQRFPEVPPQGPPALTANPAPAGPPSARYCFAYEDTTVPPGVALDAYRRMPRP